MKNNHQDISKDRNLLEILNVYSTLLIYYLNSFLLKARMNARDFCVQLFPCLVTSHIASRNSLSLFQKKGDGIRYSFYNFILCAFLNYLFYNSCVVIHSFIRSKKEEGEDFEITEKTFLSYVPNIKRADVVIIEKFYRFVLAFLIYIILIFFSAIYPYFFLKINIFDACKTTLIDGVLISPFFSFILIFIPISSLPIPEFFSSILLFFSFPIPFSIHQYKKLSILLSSPWVESFRSTKYYKYLKFISNNFLLIFILSQIVLLITAILIIRKDIDKKEKREC